MPLRRWLAENGFKNFEGVKAKKKLLSTGPMDWSFQEDPALMSEQLDRVVQSVRGHVWELPWPTIIPDALLQFGQLFDDDCLRLNG